MRLVAILLAVLTSGCATQYAFEKSKYSEGSVCQEMVGTWFTDVTVQNKIDGKKRDITRLDRKADGTAYLKGISVYYKTNEVVDWEFPSKWSCDGDWYVESNEWGYTSFKIISLDESRNVLLDERNNLNGPSPINVIESTSLNSADNLIRNPAIKEFLGL